MPKVPDLCTCGRIVAHGERCPCQIASTRARNRRHDQHRPTAWQCGYKRGLEALRVEFQRPHPTCALAGCGAPSEHVNHIKTHKGDKTLFWNLHNLHALCAHCHNSVKQRQERSHD